MYRDLIGGFARLYGLYVCHQILQTLFAPDFVRCSHKSTESNTKLCTVKKSGVKRRSVFLSEGPGPGGFMEFQEASRNHSHLSCYL